MNNAKDVLFGRWQERTNHAYPQGARFADNDLNFPHGQTEEVDVLFRQYREASLGHWKPSKTTGCAIMTSRARTAIDRVH